MKLEKIAAYGTLRQGHYNFSRFHLNHLSTQEIEGFELWDFGPYPYVIEKPGSKITIDILECDENTKRMIDRMETGAGYKTKEIEVDGQVMTIYVMSKIYPGTEQIPSGDYNKK